MPEADRADWSKLLHVQPKTASTHANKGEPKMFEAIWLGISGRTEGVFSAGAENEVMKCRATMRLPDTQRWDAKLLPEMESASGNW